jgi:muconolactone delta-isomerase
MQGIKTYEIKVSCSIPVIEIYHVEAHDAREAEELYYDGKSRFIEDDTGDVEDHEVFSVEETEEG